MKTRQILLFVTVLSCALLASSDPHAAVPAVSADQAIQQLRQGNQRYVAAASQDPRRGQERRCQTVSGGQHPVAAVLACADSRAPVELIFDQGIGDLFVIRVAGNVADTDEVGTLEYGVGHLGIPLVVVLGHSKCGAVTAVVEGAEVHGCIGELVDNIAPAVKKAQASNPKAKGGVLLDAAIRENVLQSMEDMLRRSDTIRIAAKAGKVKVVGAIYDLHLGGVEWIGPHPAEAELLKVASSHATPQHQPKPIATGNSAADGHATDDHTTKGHKPVEPAHDAAPGHDGSRGAGHGAAPAHASPAKGHAPAHDDAHQKKEPAHGTPHTQVVQPATQPVAERKPHNFIALGGLLAGGGALSAVAIRLIYIKRK